MAVPVAIAVAALVACAESSSPVPEKPAPALQVVSLSIDAKHAPRGDAGLIAGEPVRIGIRIHGGEGPYTGRVTASRVGRRTDDRSVAPIDASVRIDNTAADGTLAIATLTTLATNALSGVYRLRAHMTDADGNQTVRHSAEWRLIGNDAALLPAPTGSTFVQFLDVAGRRRSAFVRGERVMVHVRVPSTSASASTPVSDVAMEFRDPDGEMLANTRIPLPPPERSTTGDHAAARDLRFPLDVPRLARAGIHTLRFSVGDDPPLIGSLSIAGTPWVKATALVVEAMTIYGGTDRREIRTGRLRMGETLTLEARVGGALKRVALSVRLSGHLGVADNRSLGEATIARPHPSHRVFVEGTWQVPTALIPGRYQLQIQAIEEDNVSVRTREVIIQ